MTTVKKLKPKTPTSFPTQEVEDCIREFLAHEGEMQAELHGEKSEPGDSQNTIGPQPSIDSLVAVELLIELEAKVIFELSEDLIKAGGYYSIDDVVQNLMPQLKQRWEKHHGGNR